MVTEISTAQDLYNVRNDLTGDYIQTANIDINDLDDLEVYYANLQFEKTPSTAQVINDAANADSSLFTCAENGDVVEWNISDGDIEDSFNLGAPLKNIALGDKYIYVSLAPEGGPYTVSVYEVGQYSTTFVTELTEISDKTGAIHVEGIDNERVFIGGRGSDENVYIYEEETFDLLDTIDVGDGVIAIDTDDDYLYILREDGSQVDIYDLTDYSLYDTISITGTGSAMSVDDTYIYIGKTNGDVLVYDKSLVLQETLSDATEEIVKITPNECVAGEEWDYLLVGSKTDSDMPFIGFYNKSNWDLEEDVGWRCKEKDVRGLVYHERYGRDNSFVIVADSDNSKVFRFSKNTIVNWEPIGHDYDNQFTGSFDGQDYTISNLTINRGATIDVGLFGYVGDNSSFKNINIENVDIVGDSMVGALFGEGEGEDETITVDNCHVKKGSVSGIDYVGGLIGYIDGFSEDTIIYITNCSASCSVTGRQIDDYYSPLDIGGLAGWTNVCNFENCSASGDVSGKQEVGGLLGLAAAGNYIRNCHATGNVEGKAEIDGSADSAGGLIGVCAFEVLVENCYATGDVTSSGYGAAGLIGWLNHGDNPPDPCIVEECYATGNITVTGDGDSAGGLIAWTSSNTIKNCYATGDVTAPEWVGGLIASNALTNEYDGLIENCYSCGAVSAGDGAEYVGGLIGENDDEQDEYTTGDMVITACYYDSEASGQSDTGKGEPRTTTEMTYEHASNTYEDWDFVSIWGITETYNGGYPYFLEGVKTYWNWDFEDVWYHDTSGNNNDYYPILEEPEAETDPYLLYFIEKPQVKVQAPQANVVKVISPTDEYTARAPELSKDDEIERSVNIDEGNEEVCEKVAKELLSRWSKELKSIIGNIFLNQDLSFKKKVNIVNPEALIEEDMIIQKLNHNIINQTTEVTCGDIILDDAELLARILDDIN